MHKIYYLDAGRASWLYGGLLYNSPRDAWSVEIRGALGLWVATPARVARETPEELVAETYQRTVDIAIRKNVAPIAPRSHTFRPSELPWEIVRLEDSTARRAATVAFFATGR